jgi:hypothetical protein
MWTCIYLIQKKILLIKKNNEKINEKEVVRENTISGKNKWKSEFKVPEKTCFVYLLFFFF